MSDVTTTDAQALDEIADLLSGNEWDADTIEAIAQLVRQTGRPVEDVS